MLWYFPLEAVGSRYTAQLCRDWMPSAFEAVGATYHVVEGARTSGEIHTGSVLDACERGVFACTQVAAFLECIQKGRVRDGDVLFFQDFWTPGIEAIPYALHLHGIQTTQFAMCHAQSVDEFDFTHKMLPWIRGFEIGLDRWLTGIFVASTVHRDQLRAADFRSLIHVVGLPISVAAVETVRAPHFEKEKAVIYSSRVDAEKNPDFMRRVALEFLDRHADWEWWVTTSAPRLRSNQTNAVEHLRAACEENSSFKILEGLSKHAYYERLDRAAIQFNSASQDYVSWTLLEASIFGCDLAYPNFRSFPECVPANRLYPPGDVLGAVGVLEACIEARESHREIAVRCDTGRMREAKIIAYGQCYPPEINIWEDA